jgi:membrane-associated phospholipid phosphatase
VACGLTPPSSGRATAGFACRVTPLMSNVSRHVTHVAARALSVLGHPALLVPIAVVLAAATKNAPSQVLYAAAAASVFVAVSVVVYSLVQVRAGRWSHVDASIPQERGQLNLFLASMFFGGAALLWWSGQPRPIFTGLAVAGALVAFAHVLRSWLKVSLHAAFAVFAASLLWPSLLAVVLVLFLAAGVSWSRLVLRRHTPREVVVGLLAGGAAGLGFNLIAS